MIKAIAIDDEPFALNVIESHSRNIAELELLQTFTQPKEAMKYLRKFPVDLVFIDILMPQVSGLDLVKSIDQNTLIIFTTAFSQYAVKSYELNALDYLLKPISPTRFQQAVQKAIDYYEYRSTKVNDHQNIFVRSDFYLKKIALEDIEFIEGFGDYLKISLEDQKTVVTRMSMKAIIAKLPSTEFLRVHRSFIIPLSKIQSVSKNTIVLKNKEIPIGRTYLRTVSQRLNRLSGDLF